MPPKLKNGLSLAIFLIASALVVWKIAPRQHLPSTPSIERMAMLDFYLNSYLPAELLAAGENPYGQAFVERHHLGLGYPPFSPLNSALHLPLTALPVAVAGWVYFGLQLILILLLAFICLKICGLPRGFAETLLLGTLIIISRPGYSSLFLGQFTPLCIIGTYLALHCATSRPNLSILGLVLISLKAQFFIPVALFMLARRNYRPLLVGTTISAVGALLPLCWIALHQGGFAPIVENFWARYGHGIMPAIGAPGTQFMRMDLGDTLSKFLDLPFLTPMTSTVVLGMGCFILSKRRSSSLLTTASFFALICLLLSIYHCAYDAMLLVLPILALWFQGRDLGLPASYRYPVIALLGFPLVNHLMWQIPLRFDGGTTAWKIGTSLNTFALTGGFVLLSFALLRSSVRSPATTAPAASTKSRSHGQL